MLVSLVQRRKIPQISADFSLSGNSPIFMFFFRLHDLSDGERVRKKCLKRYTHMSSHRKVEKLQATSQFGDVLMVEIVDMLFPEIAFNITIFILKVIHMSQKC